MKLIPFAFAAIFIGPQVPGVQAAEVGPPAGRRLYLEYCASCHGVYLEGQPDWMQLLPNGKLPAPPHDETGHTWHHSDQQLFSIVKAGPAALMPGYDTDMPGFGSVLSDEEIEAVLEYIKGSWPERQRGIQARKSGTH